MPAPDAVDLGIVTGDPQPSDDIPTTSAVGPARAIWYEYKVEQIPPNIAIQEGVSHRRVAADFMERAINWNVKDGWEFFRVDTIGIQEMPGCLASLFGAGPVTVNYYVITFRRPRA